MFDSRPAFRRLHLAHRYVAGTISLATDERQVRHALAVMARRTLTWAWDRR